MSDGTIDIDNVKEDINQLAGEELAYNLNKEDPTQVDYWVSTDSLLLDSIIADGMRAGIPSGKVVELAGEESTGKSFLASLIASNAVDNSDAKAVVYFDSEEAQDSSFLERAGVDLDNLLYVRAKSVEFVFETIESLLGNYENILFIWDSIAQTAHEELKESDFGQRNDIASKARILSNAFKRVTIDLGKNASTLLCTNQLRDYIAKPSDGPGKRFNKEFYTPGGRTLKHTYSLRIWLKRRNAKSADVIEGDEKIGSEVKAEVKKSRFGSEGKTTEFDIIWGNGVGIRERPYWLDELKGTEYLEGPNGPWYTFNKDEMSEQFQGEKQFKEKLENDPEFQSKVAEAVQDVLFNKEGLEE